jgi:hypothetical protein
MNQPFPVSADSQVPLRSAAADSTGTPTQTKSKTSLEILSDVIGTFLTPKIPTSPAKGRKRIERPHGESLTTIEALHRIQQKEAQTAKKKKTTTVKPTTTAQSAKPKAKRYVCLIKDVKLRRQTFVSFSEEESRRKRCRSWVSMIR